MMKSDPGFSATLIGQFLSHVPHNRALGLVVEQLAGARASLRLPYRADLVGNPENGMLHGGVITSLLDACCGAAVFMKVAGHGRDRDHDGATADAHAPALGAVTRIATLDLRIDYLKPSLPPHDVIAEAECYKLTRHIAFVRSVAYNSAPDDPIASAAGTFMVRRKSATRNNSESDTRRS